MAASARRCPSCDTVLRSPVQLNTPRPTELPAVTRPQPPRTRAEVRTEAAVETTRAGVRVGVRLWRKLPRKAKFTLVGVIVALVVGVPAAIWIVGKVAYSPEGPVEDLVAAFNDGDAARVARLTGCTARLCQPNALGEGYEPPKRMRIAEVAMGGSTSPDTADVIVSYELAGQQRTSPIRVRRESGLLPQSWAIEAGTVGALQIDAPSVRTVRVAGLDLQPVAGRREPALIGTYTITVAGDDPLYEGEPVKASISGDLRRGPVTSVDLRAAVKQSTKDEVNAQVRTFLDKCAAQPQAKPKVDGRICRFQFNSNVNITAESWQYETYPVFEAAVPDKPQEGLVLQVRTTTPGSVRLTYSFQGQQYRSEPVPVEIQGQVWLQNGKITFYAT